MQARVQFNDVQQAQALALIEDLAWGDMKDDIRGLERALALALDAVGDDALTVWNLEVEEHFGVDDEFDLSAEQVASLDDRCRFAYIARLLHTIYLAYGAWPRADGNVELNSIARLLQGLDGILDGAPLPARTFPH